MPFIHHKKITINGAQNLGPSLQKYQYIINVEYASIPNFFFKLRNMTYVPMI